MGNRRTFLGTALASAGASLLPGLLFSRPVLAQTQGNMNAASWAGASDPDLASKVWGIRFTNTLAWTLEPMGFVYQPDIPGGGTFSVKAGQVAWPVLGPVGARFKDGTAVPLSTVWGYGNQDVGTNASNGGGLPVSFPGRTFVAQRGTPITVNWYNGLLDAAGRPLPHLLGVDQTISMQSDPLGSPINGVPLAVHHHGGSSAIEFDGGPDQWFTPQRKQVGPGVHGAGSQANTYAGSDHLSYTYDNTDEAAMHWYHDHAEGVTRINAYAGLAGLYIIRDANEAALVRARLLPTGEQELPLVIQDRLFQADGSLAYVADAPALNGWNTLAPKQTRTLPGFPTNYDPNDPNVVVTGSQPTHVPEMFGDIICVNGVAWPNLDVEPRQYRLRLLNGSDSRVYNLSFGGLSFWQIGTDGGLLNQPVAMTTIQIFPGERKDVVIDFSSLPLGSRLVVSNDAPFPYPTGAITAPTDPWATVLQISVSKKRNLALSPLTQLSQLTPLRGWDAATPLLPLVNTVPKGLTVRKIMLGEGCDEYGRIMPLMGTVADGTKRYQDPPDIFPALGSTEVWEFWNSTADAHPIHMHLVRFRPINRQKFKGKIQEKLLSNGWAGVKFSAPPEATTDPVPAPAAEQGWKDTVVCPPGYITRILVTFTRPGKYVYHCHILGHEEHDMMRWFEVR